MSSREAVRNARGYTLPLCGELNTTGPRHSAGSRISKGGSSSSFTSDMTNVGLRRDLRWRSRPGAFSHHYRWKPVIVHGDQRQMPEGAGFTRYLPGIRL